MLLKIRRHECPASFTGREQRPLLYWCGPDRRCPPREVAERCATGPGIRSRFDFSDDFGPVNRKSVLDLDSKTPLLHHVNCQTNIVRCKNEDEIELCGGTG